MTGRSQFVTILGFLTTLWLAAAISPKPAPAAQSDQPSRPNILFIYTDDQRWDALGVVQREQGEKARFPWLKTPNLDRLAAEGFRFRNAFVVNSLCAPSRASFLTGQYGFRNGVVNNHTPFPEQNITFASLLRESGYATGYVGKWHMDGQKGQRPGFTYSASFVGQGVYFDCPFEINGQPTPTQGWVDDVSTSYAIDFMKQNKDGPFALMVGYKSAHGPFEPPPRAASLYANDEARRTPNFDAPAIYGAGTNRPGGERAQPRPVTTNRGYFQCLTATDENVGKLLATLDELKLAEDTVVIYTSDNGFYLGEHGLGDKRSAYDESLRIPMLVRYPRIGHSGQTVDAMVLNIDVAPTALELAGLKVPDSMQGRSWLDLERNGEDAWRKAFFYCYYYETRFRVPTVTAVRSDDAKLIRYPGHDDWTELFNLKADPYELKNLYHEPSGLALRLRMEELYQKQKQAISFEIPPYADDPEADRPPEAHNAWVLDYHFAQTHPSSRIKDATPFGNDGQSRNTKLVAGRDGARALAFDGTAAIELPRNPSLNPAVDRFTVELVFRADAPEGVLIAAGGATRGFALHLKAGCPVLTLRNNGRVAKVAATQSVTGKWVTTKATIEGENLTLEIDGKPAGKARLPQGLDQPPNDGISIGADLGSPVLEGPNAATGFQGLIESLRLGSGKVE